MIHSKDVQIWILIDVGDEYPGWPGPFFEDGIDLVKCIITAPIKNACFVPPEICSYNILCLITIDINDNKADRIISCRDNNIPRDEITGAITLEDGNVVTPGICGNDIKEAISIDIRDSKVAGFITNRERPKGRKLKISIAVPKQDGYFASIGCINVYGKNVWNGIAVHICDHNILGFIPHRERTVQSFLKLPITIPEKDGYVTAQ